MIYKTILAMSIALAGFTAASAHEDKTPHQHDTHSNHSQHADHKDTKPKSEQNNKDKEKVKKEVKQK